MTGLPVSHLSNSAQKAVIYLGIAADEPGRFGILNDSKKSPLKELGWTEADCRRWCEENGLFEPWIAWNQKAFVLQLKPPVVVMDGVADAPFSARRGLESGKKEGKYQRVSNAERPMVPKAKAKSIQCHK